MQWSTETLIATCALVISVFSTGLAVWTGFLQRRHMRLSVRPVAVVPVANWEDRIGVFLKNSGLGPMRIVSLHVIDEQGNTSDRVLEHMPPLEGNFMWSNYHDTVDGATIEAGFEIQLLLLEGDLDDLDYIMSRDRVREALSHLKIIVKYEDLYGKRMPTYEKKLTWFEYRNLEPKFSKVFS